jgi:hypothetical protein
MIPRHARDTFLSILLISILAGQPLVASAQFITFGDDDDSSSYCDEENGEEEGIFGYCIGSISPGTITDTSSASQIRRALGARSYGSRSSHILSRNTSTQEHIMETLSPSSIATLVQHISLPALEALHEADSLSVFMLALSYNARNTFITQLSDARLRAIIQLLTSDETHALLEGVSTSNQIRILDDGMSDAERESFVQEETDNGNGGALILLLGGAAAIFLLSNVTTAAAQGAVSGTQTTAGAVTRPYGGRSTMVIPCTCTPGFFLVAVGPPRGGLFMYGPGTRLYSHYNIYPPAWQLGKAVKPLTCMVYVGTGCAPAGSGLLVIQAGTSVM